jgi:predicted nucleic acid-binding protein
MDKLFMDTDVIIDFLIDRQPHAYYASLLFDMSEKGELELFASSLSINNIHYVTRKILGDGNAKNLIKDLISLLEILGVGKTDVTNALKSDIKDFEDAIQYSCAQTVHGLTAIITRNTKDFKKAGLAILTPEIYLKTRNSRQI